MTQCRECGRSFSAAEVDRVTMAKVMSWELAEGRTPKDVSGIRVPYWRGAVQGRLKRGKRGLGYDIESMGPGGPRLIEVKGHAHHERGASLRDSEIDAFRNPAIQPHFWIYYVDLCHTPDPKVYPFHVRNEIQLGRLGLR